VIRLPTDKPPPPEKKLFVSQFRRRMVFIWLITLAWFSTWIWLSMSEISIGWKIVIGVAPVFSAPDASQSDSPFRFTGHERGFQLSQALTEIASG